MDAQTYVNQLKEYSKKFESWWCKPLEEFYKNYQKQNSSLISRLLPIKIETSESRLKFYSAIKQFEKDVRKDYDLIEEIFEYLDLNYESYIYATIEQRNDIRKIVSESDFSPASGMTVSIYMGNYMAEILDKYVTEHVIKELKSTGDTTWLTRGLIAISIEDCCVDFRNTTTCLAKLYVAAEKKGMNPKTAFQTIAKISSTKMPRGGGSPVSEMMETICSYAATEQERSMQKEKFHE